MACVPARNLGLSPPYPSGSSGSSAMTHPPPTPVAKSDRIVALDVLRGFAVLGILIVNLRAFATVSAAYLNPSVGGGLEGAGFWVWAFTALFAETKFISIFSLLFGAGIAMTADRMAERGLPAVGLHCRRQLWLLVIGIAHAYLIWHGDILVAYALCGFLLYPLRNIRPRRQLVLGACMVAVVLPLWLGVGLSVPSWPEAERAAMEADWAPPAAALEAETAAFRGSWLDQMPYRAEEAFGLQTMVFVVYFLWRAGGLMLVGMGLYRLGVVAGRRSPAFYWRTAVVGLGLGLPIVAAGIAYNAAAGFSLESSMFQGTLFNYVGSLGVFLGYAALVMLAVRAGRLPGLQRRLAAVGRMALTNYISQSVLCTLFFYGHGLGMFGRVSPLGQVGVVVAVWALQLAWSPWWLRRFRFGPLEWLWRTATYMRRQPFRARPEGLEA